MKRWLLYELRGFYVTIVLGMVVFSLLTRLPSRVWANDVTYQGVVWGLVAYLCFVLLIFTYLFETVYDILEKRRKK